MAFYGELLDTYDPDKEMVYNLFLSYYGNPNFTKIKEEEKFYIYMCRVYSLLSNQHRYLIAVVNENKSLKREEKLSDLKWVSFQTRTLSENFNIDRYSYNQKRGTLLDSEIKKFLCDNISCSYNCEKIPILNITLLNTKDDLLEYQKNGTIISALETFHTIITFKN